MSRRLTEAEIAEARQVFDSSLDYSRVKVYEGARWPDWLAQAAARIARNPAPTHNAVTLGNRLYFPIKLRTNMDEPGGFSVNDMAWLIHELTHAWQYQNQGWGYLWRAIGAQIRLGPAAYDYGWERGLNDAAAQGDTLFDFNPEQQGDIARHYYYRHKEGLDTSAWDPFLLFFKAPRA